MKRAVVAFFVTALTCLASGYSTSAQSSLNERILAKAESTLTIVDCPVKDAYRKQRSTGVVIASNDRRSYLLTEDYHQCARTAYLQGDLSHGFPVRSVGTNEVALTNSMTSLRDGLEVVSIERGGLPAAALSSVLGGKAFVLSYPEPIDASTSRKVQARLNEATLSPAQTFASLVAVRGITVGGGVFDETTGGLLGIIRSTNGSPPTLDVNPDPRITYLVATVPEIRNFVQFAAEQIDLAGAATPAGDTSNALRALRDAVFPVMQPGNVIGGAGGRGYEVASVAFAVGSNGTSLLLATELRRDAPNTLVVQTRGSDGALQRTPVTIVARDPDSTLTLLSVPNMRSPALRFSTVQTGRKMVQADFASCWWPDGKQLVECGVSGTAKTFGALRTEGAIRPVVPKGLLMLEPAVIGEHGGGPIVDPATATVVGMSMGTPPAFVMPSEELARRLAPLGVTLRLAPR